MFFQVYNGSFSRDYAQHRKIYTSCTVRDNAPHNSHPKSPQNAATSLRFGMDMRLILLTIRQKSDSNSDTFWIRPTQISAHSSSGAVILLYITVLLFATIHGTVWAMFEQLSIYTIQHQHLAALHNIIAWIICFYYQPISLPLSILDTR